MKRRGPKVRLARQLGIALTPKAAKVMENVSERQMENAFGEAIRQSCNTGIRLLQRVTSSRWPRRAVTWLLSPARSRSGTR